MTHTVALNRPIGKPLDRQQDKDLREYLMGIYGMSEEQAKIEMGRMDIAGRTQCEMDMAVRRKQIQRHQYQYDPFKMNVPSVGKVGP